MSKKQLDTKETPIEELQCHKKYVYDTGIIFECKNNCKSEIIGEDVVDLLNELATKCSQLKKENEQLKIFLEALKEELSLANRDNDTLEKENEKLRKENQALKDANDGLTGTIAHYIDEEGLIE